MSDDRDQLAAENGFLRGLLREHHSAPYFTVDEYEASDLCKLTAAALERAAGEARYIPAPPFGLIVPPALTPELSHALGLMNFQTGPLAHLLRDQGGADIPRKVEAEQAYVLHLLLGLIAQHGPAWSDKANEHIERVRHAAAVEKAAQ